MATSLAHSSGPARTKPLRSSLTKTYIFIIVLRFEMLNTIKNRINHHNVGLKLFTKLDLETKVNKNIGNKKRSNVNQESYKGIVNVIVIVH